MNVLINKKNGKNKKAYFYEGLWRLSKKEKMFDDVGFKFKYPKHSKKSWKSKELFLKKLIRLEGNLENQKKFTKLKSSKDCLLCTEKNISSKLFRLVNVNWEDGYKHYIDTHNVKPNSEFMDHIFSHYIGVNREKIDKSDQNLRIPSAKYTDKNNRGYIKIDKNQLLIMDALYHHGSYNKKYEDKKNKSFRFSEHAGLLHFNNGELDKINILGTTNRIDPNDKEIFLPKNTDDAYDYSYIFHTHPATPYVGARASSGILYEMPSTSDIFHFIEHYTLGQTQGSIIIAPEGMYLIRKKKFDNKSFKKLKKINLNKKDIYKFIIKLQDEAIKEYPPKSTDKSGNAIYDETFFFETIAQDKKYINRLNDFLEQYDLHVDYQPRKKDKNGQWIIDTVYLPINNSSKKS